NAAVVGCAREESLMYWVFMSIGTCCSLAMSISVAVHSIKCWASRVGVWHALPEHLYVRFVSAAWTLGFGKRSGQGVFIASYFPKRCLSRMMVELVLDLAVPFSADQGSCDTGVSKECYLVDPASSHMLVSKIKPCMC
ncbi:hypothetical protein HAX54_005767, partial [Datura stramonium]|nr:hypothetical protein [Datura stramonium]